jgi:hypothetical protein
MQFSLFLLFILLHKFRISFQHFACIHSQCMGKSLSSTEDMSVIYKFFLQPSIKVKSACVVNMMDT